jgi:hypothetical protein
VEARPQPGRGRRLGLGWAGDSGSRPCPRAATLPVGVPPTGGWVPDPLSGEWGPVTGGWSGSPAPWRPCRGCWAGRWWPSKPTGGPASRPCSSGWPAGSGGGARPWPTWCSTCCGWTAGCSPACRMWSVGGFVPDRDQVRSLLVGLPDPRRPGRLRFAGRVDHGLVPAARRRVRELLAPWWSTRARSPSPRPPCSGAAGPGQGPTTRPRCSSNRSWPSRSPSSAGSRGGCATLPGAA